MAVDPMQRGERRSVSEWIFLLVAIGFGAASVFHAVAWVAPSIAPPSPAWRHALFVLINATVGLLMVRRPRWFAGLFCLLSVQQLYSHGTSGWAAWSMERRIDWGSIVVVVAVPVIAGMLVADALRKGGRALRGSH